MSKINLLDQGTINKIAAGEVIERPSAVVKELVENAMDAGATAITVEIKEGGISFIRITDNGTGIAKDEIALAFQRHSTSKIKSVEDLLTVSSLGFRGEALSSISAVSQVELITKVTGALMGSRYLIDGGQEKELEDIGCPEGTTFVIRNLFYHTPARRKFLKTPMTEAGYISELVQRMALSHPEISFKFLNNNQLKLQTSGNNKIKDVIYHIFGREIAAQLLEVECNSQNCNISGFAAKPIVSRGNRNYMNYFINGRYIKSTIINRAIEDAYKPYTMTHRYPFTALHFTIDSKLIDVNVHPTKMEIRFVENEKIYHMVLEAISSALKGKELIPELSLGKEPKKEELPKEKEIPEPFEKERRESLLQKEAHRTIAYVEKNPKKQQKHSLTETVKETPVTYSNTFQDRLQVHALKEINKFSNEAETLNDKAILKEETKAAMKENRTDKIEKPQQLQFFEEKLLSEEGKKKHRIIGQLFRTYWIVEYEEKMFLIDQHAAHEKVLFERMMKNLREKEYSSQMLAPPIILSLSLREEEAFLRYKNTLEKLGFEIEGFGGKEYSVRAVPADLLGIAQIDLLMEFVDDLVEEKPVQSPDLILEKAASMSCKAAVKGNQKLSFQEAESLIDSLMELENPYHCPHGRPVIVSMSKYEIEKKFKRIL